jgi:Cu/Zn superoxide dismutase
LRRALIGVLSAAALASGAAVFAGGAAAVHSPTGVYDAALLPPAGGTAGGAAALVDLPANDRLTVALGGLVPGGTYAFHVHETRQPGDPCLIPGPHEPHGAWLVSTLVADAAGAATVTTTAPRFTVHHDETYWIDVETPEGAVVACGALVPRAA